MKNIIRILSTSDVHGSIYPYTYSNGASCDAGMARIKTLIDSLRDENTLVVDNGDIIQGSSFTFYHYSNMPDEVCPVSEAMAQIGYDCINLGNHDFNYGEEALFRHIRASGSVCISANVRYKGELLGPEYVIKESFGKKLALFAVTTQFVPHWEKPENIANLTFEDAFDCARRITEKIKEKEAPDYIVCLYHGGFERDIETGLLSGSDTGENEGYRMFEEIKDIDAFIFGHQHQLYAGKKDGKPYIQPGFSGEYISCVEIDADTDEIEARLIKVDAKPDQYMMDFCQEEEEKVQEWLDTPLGTTDMDFLVKDELNDRLYKTQLATLFNRIQMEASGAELSGYALALRASGFAEKITMRALVNTYIFPNTLTVKKINGKILKEYLEKSAEFWAMKDGKIIIEPMHDFPTPQYHNYDMVDGVEYTIKVSNPVGERIVSLTKNGVPVKDDDQFTIVVNNYRSAGGGDFAMIQNAETVKEIPDSVVDIAAAYIEKKGKISFEPVNNIKVII